MKIVVVVTVAAAEEEIEKEVIMNVVNVMAAVAKVMVEKEVKG